MRLLLVTDAWHPQINGVVRTLTMMRDQLRAMGHEVVVLGPEGMTIGCPTYPEIRLTLQPSKYIERVLTEWMPDCIHIATEGPLGWAARGVCIDNNWPFTTSFHTRFPEYVKSRFYVPRRWTYRLLRKFHGRAEAVLVPTPSVQRDLAIHGLENTRIWGRGVDINTFRPLFDHEDAADLPFSGPLQLYVGRLAVEKNLHAFLSLKTAGTKIIVGDGPDRQLLESQYPDAIFLGPRFGRELAQIYATCDVFVFPSLTDTFGLVLLEALACGTPVAAFPADGPIDVLTDHRVATLNENLEEAIERSLMLDRNQCRSFAEKHSWESCARIFANTLVPIHHDFDQRLKPVYVTEPNGHMSAPSSLYYALNSK